MFIATCCTKHPVTFESWNAELLQQHSFFGKSVVIFSALEKAISFLRYDKSSTKAYSAECCHTDPPNLAGVEFARNLAISYDYLMIVKLNLFSLWFSICQHTSSKDKTVRSARVKSGLQHGVEAAETALQSEAETVEAAECKVIPSLDTSRVIPSL